MHAGIFLARIVGGSSLIGGDVERESTYGRAMYCGGSMCRRLWGRKLRGTRMRSLSRRLCPGMRLSLIRDVCRDVCFAVAAYSEYHSSLDDTCNGLGGYFKSALDVFQNGYVSLDKVYLRAQSRKVFQYLLRFVVRKATAGHDD